MDFVGNYTPRKAAFRENVIYDEGSKENMETIHSLAEAIKCRSVSNADILTMSIEQSAKKRARTPINRAPTVLRENRFHGAVLFDDGPDLPVTESNYTHDDVLHAPPDMVPSFWTLNESEEVDVDEMVDRIVSTEANQPGLDTAEAEGGDADSVAVGIAPITNNDDQSAEQEMSKGELKQAIQSKMKLAVDVQLLVVLNTGKLEDLTDLHGIGAKRARAILQLRQSCGKIESVDQLEIIGMKPKNIKTFVRQNVHKVVGIN